VERLFVKAALLIVEPRISQPFVLADAVVYRVPIYQKSKPIGMLLYHPSSRLPPLVGLMAEVKTVKVTLEVPKV
jgi:hypothetical protein